MKYKIGDKRPQGNYDSICTYADLRGVNDNWEFYLFRYLKKDGTESKMEYSVSGPPYELTPSRNHRV